MANNTAKCTIVAQGGYDGTKPYTSAGWNGPSSAAMYAGKTYTTADGTKYYPYYLLFKTPDFVGASQRLTIQYHAERKYGTDPTLRWALCSSDANKKSYYGTVNAVADEYKLVAGTITHTNITTGGKVFTLTIDITTLKPSTTYCLYLWGGHTTTSSTLLYISPTSKHAVNLEISTGLAYIDDNGELGAYQAYIEDGGKFDLYVAYIDNGSAFEMYSG